MNLKSRLIDFVFFILNCTFDIFKKVFDILITIINNIKNIFRKKENYQNPSLVIQNDSSLKRFFKINLWKTICEFIGMTKREKIFLMLATSGLLFTVFSLIVSFSVVGKAKDIQYNSNELKQALFTFNDKLDEYQKKNKSLEKEVKKQALLLESAKTEKIKLIREIASKNPRKIGKPNTLARCNNNPLNVKCLINGGKWKGQLGKDKYNHVIFATPEHGIRAASFVLLSYYRKHNIKTINTLVRRFSTNNHKSYANFLSKELGIGKDEEFNFIKYMPKLISAMSQYESGCKIDESYIVNLDIVTKI